MANFQTARCWGLQSSGMLRSLCWWLLTDVLEQTVGPVLKDQEVQEKLIALPLKREPICCPETSMNTNICCVTY